MEGVERKKYINLEDKIQGLFSNWLKSQTSFSTLQYRRKIHHTPLTTLKIIVWWYHRIMVNYLSFQTTDR